VTLFAHSLNKTFFCRLFIDNQLFGSFSLRFSCSVLRLSCALFGFLRKLFLNHGLKGLLRFHGMPGVHGFPHQALAKRGKLINIFQPD
jgi:hypothetical protein